MKFGKTSMVLGVVTALIIGGRISSVSAASTSGLGTSSDPIVTKSYVDEAIGNMFTALSGSTGTTPVDQQAVVDEVLAYLASNDSTTGGFTPVQAIKGQTVVGGEGAEIILRGGSAVSYCSGADGIIDTTVGKEYFNGTALEANHLIIVPRADGRGAIVTSDEAWFIIKGGYEIK